MCAPAGQRTLPLGAVAGSSRVTVREASAPVPLEDVKTGQHIACFDAAELVQPVAQWCEVVSWAVAAPVAASLPQLQITYARPSGEAGSITVAPEQLLVRLAPSTAPDVPSIASGPAPPASEFQPQGGGQRGLTAVQGCVWPGGS